jgi:hypothetical protein
MRVALVGICVAVAACGRAPGPAGTVGTVTAGGPDGVSVVPLAPQGGLLVVVNDAPVHLTFEVVGAELGVSEADPAVWIVDGQIVQVAVVPRAAIRPAGAAVAAVEAVAAVQLLHEHLGWESAYLSQELGVRVTAEPRACVTAHGAACLLTRYAWEAEASASASLMVTTVVGDHVIGLASPLHRGEDAAVVEATLARILDTLAPRAGWIDPRAEALRWRLHDDAAAPVASRTSGE